MILDVMGRGIKEQAPWCMLFADDILLCSTRIDHVEMKLEEWRTAMEERGLKISRRKTEYLGFNQHQDAEIQLQGDTLKRVKTFTYLGSTLAEDGELDAEVTHGVQSGWKNWKRVSGVSTTELTESKTKDTHDPELIRSKAHTFVSSLSREHTQLCNLRYVHVFICLY